VGDPRRYRYACCLSWGGDEPTAEVEVEVSYSVAWGSPESGCFGPPENYDPGAPDVVEDIRLEIVEGRPRPWGMGYGLISDNEFEEMVREKLEDHEADMIAKAAEEDQGADDSYRDAEWEERRMENRRG
jgi:hypothetical protein